MYLASFALSIFRILPCCNTNQYFLSFNSLTNNVSFCLFTQHLADIWVISAQSIVNNMAVNTCGQLFVWTYTLGSFGSTRSNDITELRYFQPLSSIYLLVTTNGVILPHFPTVPQSTHTCHPSGPQYLYHNFG